jgi:hypothetical protein
MAFSDVSGSVEEGLTPVGIEGQARWISYRDVNAAAVGGNESTSQKERCRDNPLA